MTCIWIECHFRCVFLYNKPKITVLKCIIQYALVGTTLHLVSLSYLVPWWGQLKDFYLSCPLPFLPPPLPGTLPLCVVRMWLTYTSLPGSFIARRRQMLPDLLKSRLQNVTASFLLHLVSWSKHQEARSELLEEKYTPLLRGGMRSHWFSNPLWSTQYQGQPLWVTSEKLGVGRITEKSLGKQQQQHSLHKDLNQKGA